MTTRSVQLAVVLAAALVPGFAGAQHQGHQAGLPEQARAELTQCLHVQPVVGQIITAAMARAESARLSNNPAEMRAAMDHLEAALRDIRAQLTPCSTGAAAIDPPAGHAMPTTQQPARSVTPATQAPAGAADPHAGHAMPAAASAPKSSPTAKPAPGTPSKPPAADPHAGHTMPGAARAPKPAAPPTPAAGKPDRSQAADPHAGHASEQQSGKQMDPVNGLMVDPATAPRTTYQRETYYFSSEQSRKEFLENPGKFAKKSRK